jgi:hypothetical protein
MADWSYHIEAKIFDRPFNLYGFPYLDAAKAFAERMMDVATDYGPFLRVERIVGSMKPSKYASWTIKTYVMDSAGTWKEA